MTKSEADSTPENPLPVLVVVKEDISGPYTAFVVSLILGLMIGDLIAPFFIAAAESLGF